MIKTSGGKMPGRAIQFTDPDGDRRTIRLGKVRLEAAREFKRKVEALLSWSMTNQSPDAQTSAWLAGLSDKMHAKLAAVKLVEPRTPPPIVPTLDAWLKRYIGQREADLKPSSVRALSRTGALPKEHFGNALPINEITPPLRSGLALLASNTWACGGDCSSALQEQQIDFQRGCRTRADRAEPLSQTGECIRCD